MEAEDLFFHIVIKCSQYSEERIKYISPSPIENSIKSAFLNILESPQISTIINVYLFIKTILEKMGKKSCNLNKISQPAISSLYWPTSHKTNKLY